MRLHILLSLCILSEMHAVELQVASLKQVSDKTPKVVHENFNGFYELEEDSNISINDITSAIVEKRGDDNVVVITLNEAGAVKIRNFTSKFVKEQIAIMVDKKCISAPRIVAPTTVGRLVFMCNSSVNDVDELVRNIQSGIVPTAAK